jgi:hypothetical protein
MFSVAVTEMLDANLKIAMRESKQEGYDYACWLLKTAFSMRETATFTGAQVAEIILEAKGYQLFPDDEENT